MEQDQSSSLFSLEADSVMQNRLKTISGWAKFIAIAGIVMVLVAGFVFALAGQTFFNKLLEMMKYDAKLNSILIGVFIFFIAFAIVWFYLLLRASSLIRQGIFTRNPDQLAEGFKMLKLYFMFSAIVTICSLVITVASNINL
jgi:F0F1-type ATP synthase membrane subunit c/vacuolar-type H+-ATPase subunit K